jgi:hypothetical protein
MEKHDVATRAATIPTWFHSHTKRARVSRSPTYASTTFHLEGQGRKRGTNNMRDGKTYVKGTG